MSQQRNELERLAQQSATFVFTGPGADRFAGRFLALARKHHAGQLADYRPAWTPAPVVFAAIGVGYAHRLHELLCRGDAAFVLDCRDDQSAFITKGAADQHHARVSFNRPSHAAHQKPPQPGNVGRAQSQRPVTLRDVAHLPGQAVGTFPGLPAAIGRAVS